MSIVLTSAQYFPGFNRYNNGFGYNSLQSDFGPSAGFGGGLGGGARDPRQDRGK